MFFFVFRIFCIKTFIRVAIWRSLFIRNYIIKDHVSCKNENFQQHNLRSCSLITSTWLGHVNWRSGSHLFWFAFPTSLMSACQVLTRLHHVKFWNGSVSFWYLYPLRLLIVVFVIVALWCFRWITWSRHQNSWHR